MQRVSVVGCLALHNMPLARPTDHRPRVAAERRARMRRRLLESAIVVFADKGIAGTLIQDVVAAAGVSPGSFYKYFRTNEDLFRTLAEELSNEIMRLIDSAIDEIDNPAAKVATAIRSYLHLMRSYRIVAQFVATAGLQLATRGSVAYDFLPRDLKAAQKLGYFDAERMEAAMDMIGGTGLMAIVRIARGRTPKDYPEQIVGLLLRALGQSAEAAAHLIDLPLPKVKAPADSLFARAQARLLATAHKGS